MKFHLLGGGQIDCNGALLERLKVNGHVARLLMIQAQVGHKGLGLHGCGRLDPLHQMLRIVWKFAGNEGAIRPLIKRRTDHSVGVGNSGNGVALATTELLDDRFTTLWRADRLGMVDRVLSSPDTSGEQPDGSDNQPQPEDPLMSVHRSLRCGERGKAFSSNSSTLNSTDSASPEDRLKAVQKPGRTRWHRAGAVLGLIVTFLFGGRVCFCQQQTPPTAPDGKQIFLEHCAMCHGQNGEGVSAAVTYAGPSLQAEHNPGAVLAAMEIGPEHMPRFEYILSGDQMRAVAKYVTESLAVIPLTGGDVSEGGELYRTYCGSCHRTDVRGGALAFVGTNAPSLVDKSPALIAGAIRWGPGPMPSFPPAVLNDQQIASIVDYIAQVKHPASPGGSPMNWYGPVAEGYAAWVAILVMVLFCVWTEHGGRG